MEQHVFAFSLIIEGTTEKVRRLINAFEANLPKTLCFIEKNVFFEHSNNKKLTYGHYFCHENIFLAAFSELPPTSLC
jgi:hypothetical protein